MSLPPFIVTNDDSADNEVGHVLRLVLLKVLSGCDEVWAEMFWYNWKRGIVGSAGRHGNLQNLVA